MYAGSILPKPTCANVLTPASAINGHRGPCWSRCPGAITAVLFREFQQCLSWQILGHGDPDRAVPNSVNGRCISGRSKKAIERETTRGPKRTHRARVGHSNENAGGRPLQYLPAPGGVTAHLQWARPPPCLWLQVPPARLLRHLRCALVWQYGSHLVQLRCGYREASHSGEAGGDRGPPGLEA